MLAGRAASSAQPRVCLREESPPPAREERGGWCLSGDLSIPAQTLQPSLTSTHTCNHPPATTHHPPTHPPTHPPCSPHLRHPSQPNPCPSLHTAPFPTHASYRPRHFIPWVSAVRWPCLGHVTARATDVKRCDWPARSIRRSARLHAGALRQATHGRGHLLLASSTVSGSFCIAPTVVASARQHKARPRRDVPGLAVAARSG